ncbi:MAG: hypothetical protein AABY37_01780 [Actinomycetota bacterium]
MKNSRGLLAVLTLISIIGISLGAYTYVYRAISEQVYTYRCGNLYFKPSSLPKFCTGAGAIVANIKWETWGAQGATGVGRYSINPCDLPCVDEKWKYTDVKVILSKPVRDKGKRVLSRIDIVTDDKKNLPSSDSSSDGWALDSKHTT